MFLGWITALVKTPSPINTNAEIEENSIIGQVIFVFTDREQHRTSYQPTKDTCIFFVDRFFRI